jgi:nucleoside 2-deoxyribosyltransferase
MRSNSRGAAPITVFLGGPIQHALHSTGYRPDLRETIQRTIAHLSDAGFRVFSAHAVERFGDVDMTGLSAEVASRDIEWMRDCDVFACFLPPDPAAAGWSLRTDGTCVELGWASALGRPIVIMRDAAIEYSHLIAGLHAVTPVRYLDVAVVALEPASLVTAIREFFPSTGSTVVARAGGRL